jgi:DNA-directed RNA polymerase subunit omega
VRDEYLLEAQSIVEDPNALINLVSRRSKQLKHGSKPLIESLEKLDVALREIIEGKITFQAWDESLED